MGGGRDSALHSSISSRQMTAAKEMGHFLHFFSHVERISLWCLCPRETLCMYSIVLRLQIQDASLYSVWSEIKINSQMSKSNKKAKFIKVKVIPNCFCDADGMKIGACFKLRFECYMQ